MKLRFLSKVLFFALIVISAISCNDNLDQLGFTIQPSKDRLYVGIDTLELEARTVQVESVYSKTHYPVLGEYTDPYFGSIKSGYLGEFYLPSDISFKPGAVIDSVQAVLSYRAMMGDSLAPMQLSVFEINKTLEGVADYTNIVPESFVDINQPLGVQSYTGNNSTFRIVNSGSGSTYKLYEIKVDLPKNLGQRFLDEYNKPGHGNLSSTDQFRSFFPGLYFTTTFGKSTIISVDLTSLFVHYHYLDEGGSSTKQDTIRSDAFRLNVTPEVRQINSISNNNNGLLEDNATHTYIKSPAGVNTEIKFPISKIHDRLKEQALNLANLTISALPEASEDELVKVVPPDYLLLINKDSLEGFFENNRLPDNVTSFLSSKFDISTFSYDFTNISSMLNYYNEQFEGKPYDLDYLLIPVEATYTSTQGGYYSSPQQVLTGISNQMWPTATMLDKRKGNLQLELIFSNF
ncbi:MAG: DUF4270 domain-containing protein [Fermentimonas sp.]|jgi:hypothetical protein